MGRIAAVAFLAVVVNLAIDPLLPAEWPFEKLAARLPPTRVDPAVSTVFVGSSLTRRHVDPLVVDRVLASAGISSRSVNLGAQGYLLPISLRTVDLLVRERPPTLRTVVYELGPPWTIDRPQRHTARGSYWHTPAQLRLLWELESVVPGDFGRRRKAARAVEYAVSTVERLMHVGLGRGLLEVSRTSVSEEIPVRGFRALPEHRFGGSDRRLLRLRRLALRAYDRPVSAPGEVVVDLLADLATSMRRAGIRPVFLVPPRVAVEVRELRAAALSLDVPIIDLGDPRLHPELYRPGEPGNLRHLGPAAAGILSEKVGRCLVWLETAVTPDAGPPICDGGPAVPSP